MTFIPFSSPSIRSFIVIFMQLGMAKLFLNFHYYLFIVSGWPEKKWNFVPWTHHSFELQWWLVVVVRDLSRIEKTTTTVSTQRVTIRGLYTCRVVDVGGSRAERTTKWAQCFRDTTAVMYVVDSSAFDLNLVEAPKKASLQLKLFFVGKDGKRTGTGTLGQITK